jgi:hypothetical protein
VPAIARRAGKGIRETRDALGIDAIRDDIHDVRSTFSEPLSITAAPDAPAAATARDEVSNRPVAPALPERPSAVSRPLHRHLPRAAPRVRWTVRRRHRRGGQRLRRRLR